MPYKMLRAAFGLLPKLEIVSEIMLTKLHHAVASILCFAKRDRIILPTYKYTH